MRREPQETFITLKDALIFKKKEKRKKTIRQLVFEKIRKRKESKPVSIMQKFLNDLGKKKITDEEEIRKYLNEKAYGLSGNSVALLRELAAARVVNGRIMLSDSLARKKLKINFYFGGFQTKVITNDWLYSYYAFNCCLDSIKKDKENEKDEAKDVINYYYKIELNTCHVISGLFLADGIQQKGYIQDYNENICGLNVPADAVTIGKMMESSNKGVIKVKGEDYYVCGDDKWLIIYKANENDVPQKVANQKTITTENISLFNEKILNIKNKPRFFQSKYSIDKFCPGFVILPKSLNMVYRFICEPDYNSLFSFMDEYYTKYKLLPPIRDLLYWDRVDDFFEFMLVYALTSKNKEIRGGTILQTIERYYAIKDYIQIFGKNQIAIGNLYVDFFNSFVNKISYDKMDGLRLRALKLIDVQKLLLNQEDDFNEMKKILTVFKVFSDKCLKQLEDNILKFINSLEFVLTELISARDVSNVVNSVKRVGRGIYRMSSNPFNICLGIFPYILSPGAFLGNVVDNIVEKDNTIDDIIKDFYREIRTEADKINVSSSFVENVLKNLVGIKDKILQNSVLAFLKKNQASFGEITNEKANELYNFLKDKLYKNDNIMSSLDKEISSYISMYKEPNTIILNSDEIGRLVSEEIKRRQEKNEINKTNNDIQALELKKKMLQAQQNYKEYVPSEIAEGESPSVIPGVSFKPEDVKSVVSNSILKSYISTSAETKSSANRMKEFLYYNKKQGDKYDPNDEAYKKGLKKRNNARDGRYVPYDMVNWYVRLLEKSNAIKKPTKTGGLPITKANVEEILQLPYGDIFYKYDINEADIEALMNETGWPDLDKYIDNRSNIDLDSWPEWTTKVNLSYLYDNKYANQDIPTIPVRKIPKEEREKRQAMLLNRLREQENMA